MRRPGQQDVLIVITSPAGVESPRDFSPFDADDPDGLVFCCFFRQVEHRAQFLARLRETASEPGPETAEADLASDYARMAGEGQSGEAFFLVVRWRTRVLRRGYHTYSLRIGFEPYRTSCIVSFAELDAPTVRRNLSRALRFVERERARVVDFFGLN